MSDHKSQLVEKWAKLPAIARSGIAISVLFVVVMVFQVVLFGGKDDSTRQRSEQARLTYSTEKRADLALEQFAQRLKEIDERQKEELAKMRAEQTAMLERIVERVDSGSAGGAGISEGRILSQLKTLSERLDRIEEGGSYSATDTGEQAPDILGMVKGEEEQADDNILNFPPQPGESPSQPESIGVVPDSPYSDTAGIGTPAPSMNFVGFSEQANEPEQYVYDATTKIDEDASKALNQMLLPGSQFEIVLLSGMDVPTSDITQKNPVPFTAMVKSEAILPNFYAAQVRDCRVQGAGYGDIANERAILRAEVISCVLPSGKPYVKNITAYITGEDGKTGFRGRVTSRSWRYIRNTLLAGTFAGIGDGLVQDETPTLDIGLGDVDDDADVNDVVRSGLATGASSAAHGISNLFLKYAGRAVPIIELEPLRRGTVFIQGGASEFSAKG